MCMHADTYRHVGRSTGSAILAFLLEENLHGMVPPDTILVAVDSYFDALPYFSRVTVDGNVPIDGKVSLNAVKAVVDHKVGACMHARVAKLLSCFA